MSGRVRIDSHRGVPQMLHKRQHELAEIGQRCLSEWDRRGMRHAHAVLISHPEDIRVISRTPCTSRRIPNRIRGFGVPRASGDQPCHHQCADDRDLHHSRRSQELDVHSMQTPAFAVPDSRFVRQNIWRHNCSPLLSSRKGETSCSKVICWPLSIPRRRLLAF